MAAIPRANNSKGSDGGSVRRLLLFGHAVELHCHVPALEPTVGRLLGSFAGGDDSSDRTASSLRGSIQPYAGEVIARRLPANAASRHEPGELTEMYVQDERSWVIDERWGMSEINLMKREWTSWVLPAPKLDPVRISEAAILRPMALLLQNKGLHLIPAAAVSREHMTALILSPLGLERELRALLDARYRVIGQRWTAAREEGDRVQLLAMPGMVPQRPSRSGGVVEWVDLTATNPLSVQPSAPCSHVLVIDAARRPRLAVRSWAREDAAMVLRFAWPLPELHPQRRTSQLVPRLAQRCECLGLQLSHDPADLVSTLESLRAAITLRAAA